MCTRQTECECTRTPILSRHMCSNIIHSSFFNQFSGSTVRNITVKICSNFTINSKPNHHVPTSSLKCSNFAHNWCSENPLRSNSTHDSNFAQTHIRAYTGHYIAMNIKITVELTRGDSVSLFHLPTYSPTTTCSGSHT